METFTNDNPGDCQAAAADSTTAITATNTIAATTSTATAADNNNVQQAMPTNSTFDEAQQQVSSTTTTTTATQKCDSSPPNNNNNNNKIKSQQQQQQQQHHQFRAPQQFIKHKKSTSTLANKKNKTWNKRQNKTGKQQQQQNASNAIISGGSAGLALASGSGGTSGSMNTLNITKADVENIQNLRNQLGSHHYYHHHNHHRVGGNGNGGGGNGSGATFAGSGSGNNNNGEGRNAIGNNALPPSSLAGLDKLGYGHGHLKQQLYKKLIMHRGHHHVLCAGGAHNTLGGGAGGNSTCCLINGCNGHNGKESSAGAGGVNANAANVANIMHYCCGRSKFFLSDKRPRKEIFVPPTKFLLGGNISDPLNLNSLQNETSNASSNNTPATTPRQSPITTPPKVEVIIPPNIHDPLHLLDPVDSMEYEKQLTSPMKRCLRGSNKPHHKHRHRKNRKPKRRRYESCNSTTSTSGAPELDDTSSLDNSTISTETALSLSVSTIDNSNNSSLVSVAGAGTVVVGSHSTAVVAAAVDEQRKENVVSPLLLSVEECLERNTATSAAAAVIGATAVLSPPQTSSGAGVTTVNFIAQQHAASASGESHVAIEMLPRERANRDLRLELNSSNSTCGNSSLLGFSTCGSGGGGGRKRKISESNNSQKNKKFHRLDSMDKIVSPVVPQPGAWKRPPRSVPSGARKPSRRSISVSETEILSPADETFKSLLLEAECARVDTPDLTKFETISEAGVGSPLSTASGAASAATAGEHESLIDTSTADNSAQTAASTDDANVASTATATTTTATATVQATKLVAISSIVTKPTLQVMKMPKFQPDGLKYRYGNYERYAGFRHLNEFVDVRLQVFERHLELFQNKDILDIGCNVGHMTIAVARNLGPKSILGIDIDKQLIGRARRNLSMYVRIPTEQTLKKECINTKASGTADASVIEMAVATATATVSNAVTATPNVSGTGAAKAASGSIAVDMKMKRTRRKRKNGAKNISAPHQHVHTNLFYHHLHHHHHHSYQQLQKQKLLQLRGDATEFFPVSFPATYGGLPAPVLVGESISPRSTSTPGHPSNASSSAMTCNVKLSRNDFPRNVFFRQTNYVLKDEAQLCNDTQQYDVIMCLSVTKWIHLNFGDAGLKLAFKRMFNQLRPGGKLILEAQNWASYKKKKNLTEEIYNNYNGIEFFPNKFHEYLLSTDVGFSHSYTLGVPRHLSKGFCRPIQLYAKGDYTPNHVRWSDAYYPQTPYEAYRGIYATMPPRPAGMAYPMSSTRSQAYDTPHYTGGASGPYSCRQTPMHQPTSQYYNPLETDSYLPSYDMEYLNHMYVFASPLYQTVWSPPASLRNSSSHTPVFGSVRDAELDGDGSGHRHVYPPNEDTSSPNANTGGAFNSIREADTDDSNQLPASSVHHVYATNCGESSSSPQVLHHHHDSETIDGLLLDDDNMPAISSSSNSGAAATTAGAGGGATGAAANCCDLHET